MLSNLILNNAIYNIESALAIASAFQLSYNSTKKDPCKGVLVPV